jgi:hypothetical protein
MGQILFADNARSTLASPISSSSTTVTLSSAAAFPNPGVGQYFIMTFVDAATGLLNEVVWVTAVSGNAMTIVRAQEGTAALAWNSGDLASNFNTSGTMQRCVLGNTYAGNPNGNVAGSVGTAGVSPPDTVWDSVDKVWWTCTTSGPALTAVWTNQSTSQSNVIGVNQRLTLAVTANATVAVYATLFNMTNSVGATIAKPINVTVNTATSGLNGIDTGSIGASQWYAAFGVSNGTTSGVVLTASQTITGNTVLGTNTITSASSTTNLSQGAPILGGSFPAGTVVTNVSGTTVTVSSYAGATATAASFVYFPTSPASGIVASYPYYAYAGAVRTNSGSNLLASRQTSLGVQYTVGGPNVGGLIAMASGSAGYPGTTSDFTPPTWVALSVLSVVPPTATHFVGLLELSNSAAIVAPNPNYAGIPSTANPPPVSIDNSDISNVQFDFELESGFIYWASTVTISAGVYAMGWRE